MPFFLYPSNLHQPWNYYRLFTYPLYVGGGINWFQNSLVILVTGYVIEYRLVKKDIYILIGLSSFIGGLIYIILNQEPNFIKPIATPSMISWGYLSATIAIGLIFW